MFSLSILGTAYTSFKEKFGTPRQSQIAKHSSGYIEIAPEWDPHKCLMGLEGFSHIWVIFWFHQNNTFQYKPMIQPPRLDHRIGILATRAPMRPNPMGLSLVKVEKITPPRIYISGIDLIEGTPVLDIKPYIAEYDSVPQSTSGWLDTIQTPSITVSFEFTAQDQLSALNRPHLEETITSILQEDIRNRNDKREKNLGKRLGFYLDDLNIVFYFETHTLIRVSKITKRDESH